MVGGGGLLTRLNQQSLISFQECVGHDTEGIGSPCFNELKRGTVCRQLAAERAFSKLERACKKLRGSAAPECSESNNGLGGECLPILSVSGTWLSERVARRQVRCAIASEQIPR